MSDLVAVAYDDRATAERVREELFRLVEEPAAHESAGSQFPQMATALDLADAVIVTRSEDGKVKLHQGGNAAAAGAGRGALWGGLIGLIFLAPLLGAALGAAAGGARGAITDVGVDDDFMRELGESLPAGGAALIVLVRSSDPDKVLGRISRYGGRVIKSSLTAESEDRLRDALAQFDASALR